MSSLKDDQVSNEEEEMTFVVELSGILDADLLNKVKGNCKVLGIDSEKPLLQLDQYTFTGEYEDLLGTCMLFEEKEKSEVSQLRETRQNILHHLLGEDSMNTSVDLEFSGLVTKKLVMKRAFLTHEDEENEGKSPSTSNQESTEGGATQESKSPEG